MLSSYLRFPYLVLLGLPWLVACQSSEELTDHPNVLFISIDDLNDWVAPLGGHQQVKTPHLEAFASQSVNFKRNYCTSPGCNPSRSTLMTGYHTYASGMYSNYQDWRKVEKLAEAQTLGEYFRDHGYYSAGAGKIFHYSQVAPECWDDYFPSQEKNMPDNYLPPGAPVNMPPFPYMYSAFDWAPIPITNEQTGDGQSVQYITQQLEKDHDRPFFLACGIYRPHLPWYVPQAYFDLYPLDSIALPLVREDDAADLGTRARELISRGGNYHKHVVASGQWKQAVQGYLASISFADAMVGQLLQTLDQSKYADNTIVVLWSDHGWQLGEKEHWRKFALWENVIRTVLMIKSPPGIRSLPQGSLGGTEVRSLTSLLDIYPTLVDLCGLTPRADLDGESLVPLLRDSSHRTQRSIITTYDFADYSVRAGHWHYISYVDGSEELYDLRTDPEEWTNLASDHRFDQVRREMASSLPVDVVPLAEETLIPLMEHHIPPVKSREYYFSAERRTWLERFETH